MTGPRSGLGLFGGTFDPVHNGHLRVALDVLETPLVNSVRFIPSAVPPHHKRPGASPEQRLRLLTAALGNQPGFHADGCELSRPGMSYTYDTVNAFRTQHGDRPLFLILGIDAFMGLPTWHRWRELLDLCHMIVMSRPGNRARFSPELQLLIDKTVTDNETAIAAHSHGNIWFQPVTEMAISSTDIRDRLHNGLSARYLVPDSVARMLDNERLYRPNVKAKTTDYAFE